MSILWNGAGHVSASAGDRMKIDTRPRHRNAPRPAEKSAPAFLQWLRGRECAFRLCHLGDCIGKMEAMHLDFAGGKGMATKVADRFALPACTIHHRMQHALGWKTFMESAGVSRFQLLEAASKFWRTWPGRVAWERKQEANGG